jgi:cytochrome c oxidase cbb3-type subunit 1
MMICMLLFSGIATGLSFVDPEASFGQALQISQVYQIGRSVAWGMLAIGQTVFALHFLLMLMRIGQPGGEPTLFAPIGEEEKH